jgi:hypothetical protein
MIPSSLTPEEQSQIHAHLLGFLGKDPSEVRRAAYLLASHEACHLVYGSSLSLGEAQARTKARMSQIHTIGEEIARDIVPSKSLLPLKKWGSSTTPTGGY